MYDGTRIRISSPLITPLQVLGVLITGMIVPYNDPNLLKTTGNAAQR